LLLCSSNQLELDAFSGELSELSKLGEVPWIFGEYKVDEEPEVIDRGEPKPMPESTDWGLLPMLEMGIPVPLGTLDPEIRRVVC